MDQLSPYEVQQLTNQTECYIHTHPRQELDGLSRDQLEAASPVKAVTDATYSLTADDSHISIAQTCTVTLPPALKSKEYHVTLISSGDTLTINPTSPDTIMGTTSLVATIQWTSLHLKADTVAANWILI
jgi:virulence-associated protein VagC